MIKKNRNTIARTEVLRCINESEKALSHSDIQLMLNGLCDRVTIYRILDKLVAEGVVHRVVNVDGVVNYAKCQTCKSNEHHNHNHNHLHFNCEKCKKVTCLDNIMPELHLPEGYLVHQTNLIVSGICRYCNTLDKE